MLIQKSREYATLHFKPARTGSNRLDLLKIAKSLQRKSEFLRNPREP